MAMQVSYGIYAKIQKKSNILPIKSRYIENNKRFMEVEGNRNNRRTHDVRPYPLIAIDTTKVQCITVYGTSKKEKRGDDI